MIVRVAAVQASPVFLDLDATLQKTIGLIEEAAALGARYIVFPESWLPGYPAWLDFCPGAALWNSPGAKAVFARLRENSVVVDGRETQALAEAALRLGVVLVVGIHERVDSGPGRGTLYNTLLTFDEMGALANAHRKLVPTYTERLLWGQGDGKSLVATPTGVAGRVGGLICWEHWMPLSRQALHNSGEDIHAAVWPTVHEMHQIASRHYAFEARCFVVASGGILRVRDLPADLEVIAELKDRPDHMVLRGGSAVIGPDGKYIAEPVFAEETIVVADCDFRRIDEERMTLDTAGHYSRPDVFRFGIRE